MVNIHPSALVDPAAKLGEDVDVGPYCIVGPDVTLGDRTRLISHVNVDGWTELGADCTVSPFSSLGTQTQDLKYSGGRSGVKIGDGCTFREYVTVNAATHDGDRTIVGSRCHIMACAHIAHDCVVGDEVIIANSSALAGHVLIDDQVIIGGLCGVHQFVHLGKLVIIAACSKVTQDVPPYMMAVGHPLGVHGLNTVGLQRHGFSPELRIELKKAYKLVYRKHLGLSTAISRIRSELTMSPELDVFLNFLEKSKRGITR